MATSSIEASRLGTTVLLKLLSKKDLTDTADGLICYFYTHSEVLEFGYVVRY